MDLRLFDYAIYLTAAAILTVWVSSTLHKNGRVFLVSVFPQEGLADSINHLLVVGFYLINLGWAALFINAGGSPQSLADMVQETVTRLGVVLLVLGGMHFFNMFVLYLIRRPKRQRPAPVNPYYQQPATGA